MKRSEINQEIRKALHFFEEMKIKLPPWAYWSPDEWKKSTAHCDEIIKNQLGWDLTDILRRGGAAGVFVRETPTTVCVEFRKSCLPVYLNGMRVPGEIVRDLPLEMLEVGVILQPSESVQYEAGGVLLYTIHWMQEAR